MKCRTEIITKMLLQQPLLPRELFIDQSRIQGPKVSNEKLSIVSFESNTTLSRRKCKFFVIFDKTTARH